MDWRRMKGYMMVAGVFLRIRTMVLPDNHRCFPFGTRPFGNTMLRMGADVNAVPSSLLTDPGFQVSSAYTKCLFQTYNVFFYTL